MSGGCAEQLPSVYLHPLLAGRLVRGLGRPSYPGRGQELLWFLFGASSVAAATTVAATTTVAAATAAGDASASTSVGTVNVNYPSPACLPCPQRSPLGYVFRREPRRKRRVGRHRQERDLRVSVWRGREARGGGRRRYSLYTIGLVADWWPMRLAALDRTLSKHGLSSKPRETWATFEPCMLEVSLTLLSTYQRHIPEHPCARVVLLDNTRLECIYLALKPVKNRGARHRSCARTVRYGSRKRNHDCAPRLELLGVLMAP